MQSHSPSHSVLDSAPIFKYLATSQVSRIGSQTPRKLLNQCGKSGGIEPWDAMGLHFLFDGIVKGGLINVGGGHRTSNCDWQ
jgi:hypothetical protein